jgi:carboxyl-terminal processing protease
LGSAAKPYDAAVKPCWVIVAVMTALAGATGFVGGRLSSPADRAMSSTAGSSFVEAFVALRNFHVSRIDQDTLLQGAMQGMLTAVGDRFTQYIPPDQTAVIEQIMRDGSQIGMGAEHRPLREDNIGDLITWVAPGSSAERAGVQAGDIIEAINGEDMTHLTLREIARHRIGPAGQPFTMRVRRRNTTLEVHVVRERYVPQVVRSAILTGGIGYIRISDFFSARTVEQFRGIIDALLAQHVRALILDVRDNAGGQIDPAVRIADIFLKRGLIFTTRDRDGRVEIRNAATDQPSDVALPLVVLTNRFTASAAEILVSALKENGRAVIVGERTRGKGVANGQVKLPDGGALFVPVVEWLDPNGHGLAGRGVEPDVKVTDSRFATAIDVDVTNSPIDAKVTVNINGQGLAIQGDSSGKFSRRMWLGGETNANWKDVSSSVPYDTQLQKALELSH